MPGILWHIWNGIHRGVGALWLWWGDGAGRVLFDAGAGSDLGFFVPLIEFFEGGWPWLLLWPFGFAYAWHHRGSPWGKWVLGTHLVMLCAILPLKTQLPWYSHPLWLPFALACGKPFAWLIERDFGGTSIKEILLGRIPLVWLALGIFFTLFGLVGFSGIFVVLKPYSGIAFATGIGWCIGGWLLTRSLKKQRIYGAIALVAGSFFALAVFMTSDFWLWELNENWDVKPIAGMIANTDDQQVYIEGSIERPSFNWYAGKKVRHVGQFSKVGWVLTRKNTLLDEFGLQTDCRLFRQEDQWRLFFCQTK